MYTHFFNLRQAPFSIAPDPRYLLMTHGHREALAHLMYGVNSGGGLVLLTGEIGAGKTTVCRCFLEQVPSTCNVAYIFNPKLTVDELLQSICDEFRIVRSGLVHGDAAAATIKDYVDALTEHLLAAHAQGRNNVLIIDEAQNLSADVLEQLRLLTNLETNERKLLQIILIGQPELRAILDKPELKQLAQRVIARYHLTALSERETASYIEHRLSIAGLTNAQPFPQRLARQIHRITQGVPRRINLLCDRAMLGAYAEGRHDIDFRIIGKAAAEVFGKDGAVRVNRWPHVAGGLIAGAAVIAALAWTMDIRWVKKSGAGSGPPTVVTDAPDAPQDGSRPIAGTVQASAAQGTAQPPAGLRSEKDAYLLLAQAWDVTLDDGDPCKSAAESRLHCLRSTKGLRELRQLDRPAILTLHDGENQPYYVLLTGLTDTSADIRAGDATQTLTLDALNRHFHGEFVTLWREPFAFRGVLKSGDRGAVVDWVAAQLAKRDGAKEPAKEQPFDDRLAAQVREFQTARGLTADGVIGPVTFMHLNHAAVLNEPRLRGTTDVQPDAPH
ncbi:peptidoglycan-binding protein [Noviherbaspirillum cavernae]|uniref:Peptidoglycan-binding protein n=1 Tax=Noviherbaspirillum cavernae TaxID=2320862 RepID=A0A418X3A6_9BURK|nr:ExeA family protein [Noviherbaspirillum cavernae]RJG06871.1 peptidoglycan-binding protein [Noviherbaspirillum cavernae]